jgi:TDG/mug DNA glycosylase family protein
MATETIRIDGQRIRTLKELLRPGLKAVFVGINPAPVSVERGHYYQGRLGQRFWRRLQEYGITKTLPTGAEDDAAFEQGFGFADLIRKPTRSAKDIPKQALWKATDDLLLRLDAATNKPLVAFVFAKAADAAETALEDAGYGTLRLPGPYASKDIERSRMLSLAAKLTAIR